MNSQPSERSQQPKLPLVWPCMDELLVIFNGRSATQNSSPVPTAPLKNNDNKKYKSKKINFVQMINEMPKFEPILVELYKKNRIKKKEDHLLKTFRIQKVTWENYRGIS